jgi:hypothetical protein
MVEVIDVVFPVSKSRAAELLDVDRGTVADLMRKHDLRPVPVPYSKAHGIDRDTFHRLRVLTNHVPPVLATVAN